MFVYSQNKFGSQGLLRDPFGFLDGSTRKSPTCLQQAFFFISGDIHTNKFSSHSDIKKVPLFSGTFTRGK